MARAAGSARPAWWRGSVGVLAGALLFNVGQGVLRPTMPLYLQQVFAANYRMVTAIPAVFGAGKWVASLPTGYLLGRLGRRPLMVAGLLLVAVSDLASALTSAYGGFLALRAAAGAGWAMFGTAATATIVDLPAARWRGRAVSLLMMSETTGLLLGTAAGGWLYQALGAGSPFVLEAACMVVAAALVAGWPLPAASSPGTAGSPGRRLGAILRAPPVLVLSVTNALLTAVQTGLLVFLFPLYLANRGGLGPQAVGVLSSLAVLGRLAALWVGGEASDRWGRPRILGAGLLAYAALLAGVPALSGALALAAASFALGAAAGLVAPLPTAMVADHAPPAEQGVAIGWLRTITDSGQLLGPFAAGACADAFGLPATFQLAAVSLIAAAWACRPAAVAARAAAAGGHRDSGR